MTEIAAPRFGLVLDSGDPERLVEFWANAPGYVNVGSAGACVALNSGEGKSPQLLQRDDGPKQYPEGTEFCICDDGTPANATSAP